MPCLNGGTCSTGVIPGTFNCACRLGYSGYRCENDTSESKKLLVSDII